MSPAACRYLAALSLSLSLIILNSHARNMNTYPTTVLSYNMSRHFNRLMHKDAKMVTERQIALTSKLKNTGYASMKPNPIIVRYHFGDFVH